MSMSSHIMGFQPRDEEWRQLKAIYDACTKADIEPPDEVMDFFNHEDPKNLCGKEINISEAVSDYSADMRNGFEVDLSKLPKNVKVIRFFNSY